MNALLLSLTLAFASLAVPAAAALSADAGLAVAGAPAALPACSLPGGDLHCEASAAGCRVLLHVYDVEDHPPRWEAGCASAAAGPGAQGYGRTAST